VSRMTLCVILLSSTVYLHAASTVEVHEFNDPAIEARYYSLIDELRCPKCQNTNLAGSDAPIARDLRATVYRLLVEERQTDAQAREYLVARYGDFVLYDPPFNAGTAALWLLPLLALLIGIWRIRGFTKKRSAVELTAEERSRLATIASQDQR
jgi:cytochrome c-type biogenesis protein CcmH